MEDEVVEFVVAVHDPRTAGLALIGQVPLVPRDELGPAGNVAYRLSGVDVPHGGLRARDFGEGLDLAREVRLGRAKIG